MKRLPFALINLAGLAAFMMPFILGADRSPAVGSIRAADAPWLLALMAPLLLFVAISECSRGSLDPRRIALLGILTAIAAAMRLPISLAGANLMFFLPVVGGAVFGASFGFLLGSLALGVSALITGGIGPWLPFQMWAMGWVGMGAGLLRPVVARSERGALLALIPYAAVSAFFYGAVMNLYFWPLLSTAGTAISWAPGMGLSETLSHYVAFYAVTSLVWDAVGAAANVAVILVLAAPTLKLLRRYEMRFSFSYGSV